MKQKLAELGNHPTADEVTACVQEEYPTISRATVYRVLNKLADSGDAMRVRINNGSDHFDHQSFPHYHVHCSQCGKGADVEMPIEEMEKLLRNTSGYLILGYTLQFDGICPKCQENQSNE